jgi:threonine/homoserine/homoserine lactone efflux protein
VHGAAVVVVTATCLVWQTGLALAFSGAQAAQAYARAQKPLDRGAAALMGAFGASLLWTAG